MRILVITRHNPLPGTDGAATYLGQVTAALAARGHVVGCAWTERAPQWNSRLRVVADLPAGVRDFFAPDIRFSRGRAWQFRQWWQAQVRTFKAWRLRLLGRSLPPAAPWSHAGRPWDDACNADEQAMIASAIEQFQPDVLFANFSWMTTAAPFWIAAGRPLAVLAHDARHCQLTLDADDRLVEEIDAATRATEAEHLATAQLIAAIQPREATLLRSLVPTAEVVVLPPGRPPSASLQQPPSNRPIVLFVGSGHTANREGARWLITAVWPLVRALRPDARLQLAGPVTNELSPAEGVEFLGRVPDLAPTYAAASLVVAPIRRGSGVKIKVIEALQHHRVVVATPVAADGLEFLRDALPVAATAGDFAEAIVALLGAPDRAAALVKKAEARMRVALAPETALAPFLTALELLPERKRTFDVNDRGFGANPPARLSLTR
ncbi:MAG TPA: glycosyltransferase family 4 protein [Chthoniobacterales bacterium]